MTAEQLRAAHRAQPFKPFTLHLADGESIPVTHPENLFQSQGGRTVVVNTEGEEMSIIDPLLVTRLSFENGRSGRKRRSSH